MNEPITIIIEDEQRHELRRIERFAHSGRPIEGEEIVIDGQTHEVVRVRHEDGTKTSGIVKALQPPIAFVRRTRRLRLVAPDAKPPVTHARSRAVPAPPSPPEVPSSEERSQAAEVLSHAAADDAALPPAASLPPEGARVDPHPALQSFAIRSPAEAIAALRAEEQADELVGHSTCHNATILPAGDLGEGVAEGREDTLWAYLDCGRFERGAACFECASCGQRTFVPFSCKTRSFCPSCCGRRMCDIAAHLCARVLPDVRYRQWVLSPPIRVRYLMLRHRELVPRLLAVFLRVIFAHQRRRARDLGIDGALSGAVSFEQKFGDAARCHFHIHTLIPDGVFHQPGPAEPPVFVPLPAPRRDDLTRIVASIRVRVLRLLRRAGLDPGEGEEQDVQGDLLSQLQAASLQGRIAVGPRAGWRVVRVGAQPVAVPPIGQGLCADAEGYNVHAGVHVAAGQRARLESLLRYMLRPPLARERLERLEDGRVRLWLKRPYLDGTRALVFEPQDFIARICALVCPPRVHLVHYSGIFAPHSSIRSAVIPRPPLEAEPLPEKPGQMELPAASKPAGQASRRAGRLMWAELMKRTWGIDVLACGCGGRLRLLCFIYEPKALAAISQSLGLSRAPPAAGRAGGPGNTGRQVQLRLPGIA